MSNFRLAQELQEEFQELLYSPSPDALRVNILPHLLYHSLQLSARVRADTHVYVCFFPLNHLRVSGRRNISSHRNNSMCFLKRSTSHGVTFFSPLLGKVICAEQQLSRCEEVGGPPSDHAVGSLGLRLIRSLG